MTDNLVTDVDSNGISERHFQFNVDSLVSLLGKTGGVCLLKVDYNSLNTITAQTNIIFASLSFDEIASLTATVIENDVELSWSMTAVSKTKCFEIERSEDGVVYQKVGVIEADQMVGNYQYYFKDINLTIGKHYYRLKQININGGFHYTKVVEVVVGPPQTYFLSQNYPNPFNSQTTIDYQLPKPGHVLLIIYNANGQEIIKLVDEDKGTGHYTINWEGKDSTGKKVSSGIYFYKIEVSGKENSQFVDIKKMLYLK